MEDSHGARKRERLERVRFPNLGAILVLNLGLNLDASDCPDPREPHPIGAREIDLIVNASYCLRGSLVGRGLPTFLCAGVAELVDARVSKSRLLHASKGSIPFSGTCFMFFSVHNLSFLLFENRAVWVASQKVVAQSWDYPRSAGVSPAFLADLLVVRPRWPRSQAPTF